MTLHLKVFMCITNTRWFTVNFYREEQQKQVVLKFGDRELARQGFPYHEILLVVFYLDIAYKQTKLMETCVFVL